MSCEGGGGGRKYHSTRWFHDGSGVTDAFYFNEYLVYFVVCNVFCSGGKEAGDEP